MSSTRNSKGMFSRKQGQVVSPAVGWLIIIGFVLFLFLVL